MEQARLSGVLAIVRSEDARLAELRSHVAPFQPVGSEELCETQSRRAGRPDALEINCTPVQARYIGSCCPFPRTGTSASSARQFQTHRYLVFTGVSQSAHRCHQPAL
jgi:hypothetical protein